MGHYTQDKETEAIIETFKQVKGDIIELGCNRGETTKKLAKAFPDRNIYAYDLGFTPNSNNQEKERLNDYEIGELVKDFINVDVWEKNTNHSTVIRHTCFFIDAGHDFLNVAFDTLNIFDQIKREDSSLREKPCLYAFCWHDYKEHEWVRVKNFVDLFIEGLETQGVKIIHNETVLNLKSLIIEL